ncbi:hypothetical protein L7F22_064849 [Adiantum nelumboides]|nr:hypothetical protein [Adiantum nelumboides]
MLPSPRCTRTPSQRGCHHLEQRCAHHFSGKKTGRSPKDKRIVYEETSKDDVWWGPVNIKMDEHTFEINRERAIDYLNTRDDIYVFDGFAGWDPKYRIKVRVICARALPRAVHAQHADPAPPARKLENFGEPDFIIYNAGQFPANRFTAGMTSTTSVEINFKRREMVILGTEYAGEMKKGIFLGHALPPARQVRPALAALVGQRGPRRRRLALLWSSGTARLRLSADPHRRLIGDDEHVWSDDGVFNIEGGCYAKCIGLSAEKEPEIYNAIRFGSILENVSYDKNTRVPDYDDSHLTENTRCAYPIEYINNAKIPCIAGLPKNIILSHLRRLWCPSPRLQAQPRAGPVPTSLPATRPRRPAPKTASLSPAPPSRRATASPSLSSTRVATPPCLLSACRRSRPTPTSSTLAGPAASSALASGARSSTPVPSSTPSTRASWPTPSTRTLTSSTSRCPRRSATSPRRFSTRGTPGRTRRPLTPRSTARRHVQRGL